jgi:hypothetical protein
MEQGKVKNIANYNGGAYIPKKIDEEENGEAEDEEKPEEDGEKPEEQPEE